MGEITYEQLFDTLRREKSRDELQVLEKGFYSDIRTFLAEKKAAIDTNGTLSSQRSQIEYQNAHRILKELYDRRERKIVTLAMHKTRADATIVDNEALLPEERVFFDTLVDLMTGTRKNVFSMMGEAPPVPEPPRTPEKPAETQKEPEVEDGDTFSQPPEEEKVTVKFLASVPKFVGKDLTVLGPYEEAATAELPVSIATILIKKGRAERVVEAATEV